MAFSNGKIKLLDTHNEVRGKTAMQRFQTQLLLLSLFRSHPNIAGAPSIWDQY